MAKSTKGAKRIKAAAALWVPGTREEVIEGIRLLGDAQRELVRAETEMNDAIGDITARYAPLTESLKKRMAELQSGIQTWCEAHRDELTGNGKVKFANLTTGEVQWRNRPPSVSIRGADNVIELLRRLGLERKDCHTRHPVPAPRILTVTAAHPPHPHHAPGEVR
nr:host-nuclease inhibitor Gam family protein [Escherichia coli]